MGIRVPSYLSKESAVSRIIYDGTKLFLYSFVQTVTHVATHGKKLMFFSHFSLFDMRYGEEERRDGNRTLGGELVSKCVGKRELGDTHPEQQLLAFKHPKKESRFLLCLSLCTVFEQAFLSSSASFSGRRRDCRLRSYPEDC